jgi:hypothetical protein
VTEWLLSRGLEWKEKVERVQCETALRNARELRNRVARDITVTPRPRPRPVATTITTDPHVSKGNDGEGDGDHPVSAGTQSAGLEQHDAQGALVAGAGDNDKQASQAAGEDDDGPADDGSAHGKAPADKGKARKVVVSSEDDNDNDNGDDGNDDDGEPEVEMKDAWDPANSSMKIRLPVLKIATPVSPVKGSGLQVRPRPFLIIPVRLFMVSFS